MVLAIAALALGDAPPDWIVGIGAGAGAAVVAVVVEAGIGLGRSSLRSVRARASTRWPGSPPSSLAGPYVVLVLLGAGLLELALAAPHARRRCTRGRCPGDRGGAARAGLDGAQGRRALLRRRLRDDPADAGATRSTGTAG